MGAPPYMKLYVADYLGDTHALSVVEHGAYLLLIMAMWRAGGKLPADDAKLAKIARCAPEQWAEVRASVLSFFRRRGGQITHKRLTEEMAKYETVSAKRREASDKGVSQKRRKNKDVDQPNGSRNADHLVAKPEPEPEPEREVIDTSLSQPREGAASPVLSEELIAEAVARIAEAGVDLDAAEHAKRFAAHAESTGRRLASVEAAWREWVRREIDKAPKAKAAPAPALLQTWNGPPELRSALVRAATSGEAWVRGYIDAWTRYQDVPAKALLCANAFAMGRIDQEVGHVLREWGVQLLLKERAA